MCRSMVDIQSPTAEIRRGKKKKKMERNYRMKIYMVSLLHRATIIIIRTFVTRAVSANILNLRRTKKSRSFHLALAHPSGP